MRVAQVARGVGLLVVGGLIGWLVVGFGLLALFFELADLSDFVWPAMVTSGVGLLVALGLIWEGWRQLVKK